MDSPLVYVVLVNYNNAGDTRACIASLRESTYPNFEVLVVDNASSDDSIEILEADAQEHILLKAPSNQGFAAGNNYGIRYALEHGAEYIWMLNNDTVVSPQAMQHLVDYSANKAVVAPKIFYCDEPNKLWYAGGEMRFDLCANRHYGYGKIDHGQFDEPMQVNYASGCSMLFPTWVLQKVGPWTEHFFMYWEDVEYCIRLGKAGIPILYCPSAQIWHKEGATAGKNSAITVYYANRNRFYIMKEYCPRLKPRLYTYGSRFVYMVAGVMKNDARKYIWRAFWDYRKGIKGKSWTPPQEGKRCQS